MPWSNLGEHFARKRQEEQRRKVQEAERAVVEAAEWLQREWEGPCVTRSDWERRTHSWHEAMRRLCVNVRALQAARKGEG